jgi:hypothetical protein
MKLLQQNYGFVWDHSTVCLHYGHKCKDKLSGFLHFHVKYIRL